MHRSATLPRHAATALRPERRPRPRASVCGLALACVLLVAAAPGDDDYTELDLEQLSSLSAEVTSVSRRAQRLIETPAAVAVISGEDIRRSGHTSIPELLRMVPGMQVARVASDSWTISARGFASEFANKLLVLVDGRVVYTPTFNGVLWNLQDTLLEDIERIEVIRGPGATVWGSNAVNGVINIITKSASDTLGSSASLLLGDEERAITTLRVGRPLGEHFQYRAFGKLFARDQAVDPAGHTTPDDWRMTRLGYRLSGGSGRDHFELDTNGFRGDTGTSVRDFTLSGATVLSDETVRLAGGHGLFRWRREYAERDGQELQVYYDHQHMRGGAYSEVRHSAHGEYQRELVPWSGHDLIGGVGWRFTTRRISRSLVFATDDPTSNGAYYSAFVQDEIELAAERVWLTLGTKAEWYNRAGWELQPSARLLWTPRANQQVWASIARATRAPSDAEQEITTALSTIPPGLASPGVTTLGIVPDRHFESEVLLASEVGYRIQPAPNATLDLALFWNDYENLRSVFLRPPPQLAAVLQNRARATSIGAELELQWRVRPDLRLRATYSGFGLKYHGLAGRAAEEPGTPKHQWQVGASLDLPGNVELDTTLAYAGQVTTLSGTQIDSYLRADARIAWRPRENLELSLVGQNLTDRRHPEWAFLLGGDNERELERSVYAAATWHF